MNKEKFYEDTAFAVKKIHNAVSGLLEGPTGVGKGEVISNAANDFLLTRNDVTTVVLVAPYILLSQQLAQRVVEKALSRGETPSYNRIGVHSGSDLRFDIEELEHRIKLQQYPDHLTRDVDEIVELFNDSKRRGQVNFVYTTPDSLSKVVAAAKRTNEKYTLFVDEVHKPAADKTKWAVIEEAVSCAKYFYALTATVPGKMRKRITSLFGSRIWHMEAAEAIDKGLITPPRWMIVEVSGNRKKNLAQGVVQAFYKRSSPELMTNKVPVKMLVTCSDTSELVSIAESKHIKQLKKEVDDLMVAEISSERGHIVNGVDCDRLAWIKQVNAHTGPQVVLHIQICNMGIDVPEFNLPLWTHLPRSEVKLVQGNGRGARLSAADRKLLEVGTITPHKRSAWTKPYNYVGLLMFEDDLVEDEDTFKDLIYMSRQQGFVPNDVVFKAMSNGKKSNPNDVEQPTPTVQSMIADVEIRIEEELSQEWKDNVRKLSEDQLFDAMFS